jgi:hypothetical protein
VPGSAGGPVDGPVDGLFNGPDDSGGKSLPMPLGPLLGCPVG